MVHRGFWTAGVSLGAALCVLAAPVHRRACAETVKPSTRPDPALQSYFGANGLLNRGLYELAAVEYRKFLSQYADHDKADVARYGLGVSLYRMKQYDAAIEALKPLGGRAGFEFAADVATIVGQAHLAMRRYTEAAEAFRWVLRKKGDHALADEAAAGRIEALYLAGKHGDAVSAGKQFLTRWPDSPLRQRASFFYALATMARKDFEAAADRFEAMLKRDADGPFAQQGALLLAQCRHNAGSLEQAVSAYRAVLRDGKNRYAPDAMFGLAALLRQLERPADAGTLLDQLLKKYPDSELVESARFDRGQTWFDQQQYDRAGKLFQKVADGKGSLADQGAFWAAKCELRRGAFDEAARRLALAIKAFPKSDLIAEMYYDRGVALIRAGRQDNAIGVFDAFRRRFEDHRLAPEALRLEAVAAHEDEKYKQSLTFCRAFLDRYESHALAPSVLFLAAENEFLSGDYDASVRAYRRYLSRSPDGSEAHKARFRLGTALYRVGRVDESAETLQRVVQETGGDDAFRPALLTLGNIHFERGEWNQAETLLAQYLEPGPGVALADDALLKLGLARQRQDKFDGAIEAFDSLIERFDDSPQRLQAMFERGQALVSLDRLDDAADAFQRTLQADPKSRFAPYALNHLASIAARRGHEAESSELYARAAKSAPDDAMKAQALFRQGQTLMAARRFHEAEKVFARLLSRHPNAEFAAAASANRAIAISRQDRFEEALRAITDLERRSLSALDPALVSAVQYEKAWCLRKLGRTAEAADAYADLAKRDAVDSLSAHALLELAEVEFSQERFDEASRLLHRLAEAIRSTPTAFSNDLREQAAFRLALCEWKRQDNESAAKLFEAFLVSFPDSKLTPSACFYGGEALFALRRHERAVKLFSRVADEFESDPAAGPSLLRLGESLAILQRWARAEQAYADYLERFADAEPWFQARFGVGWARENQKRYDEAIAAYRQVVERHRGETAARAQFQIGECLFAKKNYTEAAAELLKVDILYAYPDWSAAALFEAGRCFEKLGKPVEARNHFRLVADRHGATRWAKLASQRLSELSSAGVPEH